MRAGGGYKAGAAASTQWAGAQSLQDDGIWLLDMFSGDATLLVSLARLFTAVRCLRVPLGLCSRGYRV